VEDIIDSGHTLLRLSKLLSDAGAPSVKVLALLDKRGRRRVDCVPDYVGWEVCYCVTVLLSLSDKPVSTP
jgi:hypoxanthine phosphoribosyltransferase